MVRPSNNSKKRLVIVFTFVLIVISLLIIRLGYIQIIRGDELKRGALNQWNTPITIEPKRGTIYDRNGRKLAISVSSYIISARPDDIEDPDKTAKTISEVLDMEEEEVLAKITSERKNEKIKQWTNREEANKLKELALTGIEIIDSNKRFYPNENFASNILGFTTTDNKGLYGIEERYDSDLKGSPGRSVKTTDIGGRQTLYDGEMVHDAANGLDVVLTIDETIQGFAEDLARGSQEETEAKNVSILVMEPQTGDILAMANMPQYNPNTPREPLNEEMEASWKDLSQDELEDEWYDIWRNFAINDSYDPGSTFKTLVTAAAIEENIVNQNTGFHCNGFVRDMQGPEIKCARWYNPHGSQTLAEGLENSCNVVFVNLARMLGREKFQKYIKGFGFGQRTGIELTGEQGGLIPYNIDTMEERDFATMGFGQSISVTPIQLINAVSALGNGGNLMAPRLVSHLMDEEGNIVQTNEPEVKRQVISKETSDIMLKMMEGVVSDGTGSNGHVPGYKVGGKTGTSEKWDNEIKQYSGYIGSFVALAPAENPQIAVLVIVDEPTGVYYGGSVAAPLAAQLIDKTLPYLGIEKEYTEDEKIELEEMIEVPDLKGKTIEEVGSVLNELGLKHTSETYDITSDSKIRNQFPLPGTNLIKGSIIDLYFDEALKTTEKMKMPDLKGKTIDEVSKILNQLGIQYEFKGEGIVIKQTPKPGEKIGIDTDAEIQFSKDEE